ncbi:FAD-dependent monooxygenase [Deinococcus maricopensis]|uniref:Pentachlorophenol monooxygenase n=1 Tax=Deinococcus maricopensis (strain DSM 21211 / LMG 22137 / NRRL B-23946 / LB-34) TaxID=709986 RepID=E8U362_DEIML|nr:FAD-dependent monooxygenase [Deinococcus maricopensis]ADV66007.1 Pentachlorophenol monooxygenase [Deinococcus maricopensis DSM 21211]
MTPPVLDVLIAGAGPTGLFLAVWLTRLGVRVRIVDPKSGPVQETRAIAVQARTLEFYDQLGFGDAARARGRHFDRLNVFVRGRERAAVRLNGLAADVTPHPYLYILTQDQNEHLLVDQLRALGVRVEWGTAVTGVAQDDAGVTVTLTRGARTEEVRATAVAGCDGGRSAVRHALRVPLSGGTYDQRFYVADITARGRLRADDVNLSLSDDDFLACFPLPGRDRHRVAGRLPPGAPDHAGFSEVRGALEAQGLARVEAVHWFSTYRVHHRVADAFQVGRAFLLGDAAHVHTPVGGQGMNTGLGDAANLAWKLAHVRRGAPAALLGTYGAERRPFAVSLVRTTDRVFTALVQRGPVARAVRVRILPALLRGVTRPRAVRRALFLTVSQTRLHYPRSPLSVGRAGRVRGGDRLPWVPHAGGSNHDALRSLAWQVHVYGAPHPELLAWCARREVPLRVFPCGTQARRAGLLEGAAYLVRPDGYVGLAVAGATVPALDAYAARWFPPEPAR